MWFLLLLQVYSTPAIIHTKAAILSTFKTERDCNVQLDRYIKERKQLLDKHGMNPTCITMYDNEVKK